VTHLSKGTNVFDKWILASCQSLIQFVRQEMDAYRLYTVVPRLLLMIEDLTNWYVRFNRNRLKSQEGMEECLLSLNTLCHVLLTLCKAMSPFTPFLCETMYQTLKKFIPNDSTVDTTSVHYLMFPTVSLEWMNPVIERQMKRMQDVIELGRNLREKKGVSLKVKRNSCRLLFKNVSLCIRILFM
jgi:isoleucyl-tRNA synthetase